MGKDLRYFLFSLIGFFSYLIRELLKINFYKTKLSEIKIAVVGKGFSSNFFYDKEISKFTKIYLANHGNRELKFADYFKLKKKHLVIVSNLCEPTPNFLLMLINYITEVIIPKPSVFLKRNNKLCKRGNYRLNTLGVKVRGLKNAKSHIGFPNNLGNTGIKAIYEAAEYSRREGIKEICLFGFEFYSHPKNRLIDTSDDFLTKQGYLEHVAINSKLSKTLDNLVNLYPEINFINHSYNDYRFISKNIIKKIH